MNCKHKDCIYKSRPTGYKTGYCDYIGHTGKSRGCPAGECDKYVKISQAKKNKLQEENK